MSFITKMNLLFFLHFWLRIDVVMVKREMLAQSCVIHESKEFCFLHFENKNLLNVSLKQFCFEFFTIPRGFNLSLGKR